MSKDLRDSRIHRRQFLRDLAAAGGLAAVAATSGSTASATPAATPQPQAQPQAKARTGYRVTAHVSTYYEKARF